MKTGQTALGMIETWGVPALIAAADAAAKAAEVHVSAYEKVDGGLVTVYIWGDVASVKAAVDAGTAAAQQVGKVIGVHVIPRPDADIISMLRKAEVGKDNNRKAKASPETAGDAASATAPRERRKR
jgi:microcompartment protein CcmL/EutN